VGPRARRRLLGGARALLVPSLVAETASLVALEALACGTPVIARPTGALPELVRDGIDGFFGDDVRAMAFRVDRVEDLDRQAIRDSVLERFSVERMTDGYEAIYRERVEPGAASWTGGDTADASAEPQEPAPAGA